MVTDEKGDTAGVIINIGRKMIAEVLKWNDLRINGVKMHLPFENSEMVAEVFCGLVQITTNVGFAVTMDKELLLDLNSSFLNFAKSSRSLTGFEQSKMKLVGAFEQ